MPDETSPTSPGSDAPSHGRASPEFIIVPHRITARKAKAAVCLFVMAAFVWWRWDTALTRLLWKPDDFAALQFATVHADPARLAAPWSVHPGLFGGLLRAGFTFFVTEPRLGSVAAVFFYGLTLYLFYLTIVEAGAARWRNEDVPPGAAAQTERHPAALCLSLALGVSPLLNSSTS